MFNRKLAGALGMLCLSVNHCFAQTEIRQTGKQDSEMAIDTAKMQILARPKVNRALLTGFLAGQAALYAGSIYGLSKSWYNNPLTHFSVRDDTHEWFQIDKAGHLFTSFQIARLTSELYRKTGIPKGKVLLYSAISGIVFLTPIEILDGFSPEYGFSPGDMTANVLGSAIYAVQAALWDQVRIYPKFSFHYTKLAKVRPNLLGSSYSERWLKDYNGQTYWLSASPASFLANERWPAWLCVSLGYGVGDMVAADKYQSIQLGYRPYRQYYLSLDLDFSRIKTRKKWARSLFMMMNSVKVPAPTLYLCRQGLRFKPVYF